MDGAESDRAVGSTEAEHRMKNAVAIIVGWATMLDDRWDELDEARRREGVEAIRSVSQEMAIDADRLLQQARARRTATRPPD